MKLQDSIWSSLNAVYETLYRRSQALRKDLLSNKYAVKLGYYNLHTVFRDGTYQTEYFPIPVLTVDGVCDIELHLDGTFIVGTMSREQALAFDWRSIHWTFEAFGTDDTELTLYQKGMGVADLPKRIEESSEEFINIGVRMPPECSAVNIRKVVYDFKHWGTEAP